MKILAKEKLSEHKYKTPEGYLICVDSVLARTGKQTYTRDELFHDGDETEIEVDRTPEEVFSDATLASFENKPLVVEHPDEDVNSSNIQQYAVGFVRDVKRGELDGEPVMLGTLVITDEQTIKEIEDGEHTDLSCGYDCDIQDEAEPSQKNIRGNHVALCETGRAGIARIVDSVKVKDRELLPNVMYTAKSGAQLLIKKITAIMSDYDGSPDYKIEYSFKTPKGRTGSASCYSKDFWKMLTDPKLTGDSVNDATYSVETSNANPSLDKTFNNFDEAKQYCKTIYKKGGERTEIWKGNMLIAYITEQGSWWFNSQYRYGDSVEDAVEPLAKDMYKGYLITAKTTGYKNAPTEVHIIDPDNKHKFKSYFTAEADLNKALREARDYYMRTIPLTKKNEDFIGNYLNMMSGFTRRKDADIQDFIRPLQGKGYKPIVEKVEGWIWKKGSYAYKNYYMSLDGYTNKFVVTLYADPDNEWETKEFNAYFNDSIKDADLKEGDKVNIKSPGHWANGEWGTVFGVDGDDVYVGVAGDKKMQLVFSKKELKKMHDSNTNDKLIESGSEEAFKKNIATEIKAGKDPKQAAAIAYSVQRENDSDVEDVVQFDALKDAPSKGYAITKIKEIIKNPRYTSEDNEGVVYLTQEGYKLVQQLAKSNGLDRRDMEAIDWYMFGPGGYPSIVDSDEKVEDAMEKYYIRWIDQYSKSKGYDKSFWLHDDEVKANSAKEALDKLANIAVQRGVGTRYVTIVNIKTDKTSYQVSGNIDDLRKRQLDSMASTYEKATKGLKEQLNNVGDSCKVGKYKVTKIK